MFDKHLVETLLGIRAPWELRDLKLDANSRRCDIWIDYKGSGRNWFGSRREGSLPEKSWRHLNTMDIQTWVHVTPPIDSKLEDLPWAGDDAQPFTHAMARQLLTLMDSGLPLEAVCRIFDISVNDLWRYKYAIENAKSRMAHTTKTHGAPPTQVEPPQTMVANELGPSSTGILRHA